MISIGRVTVQLVPHMLLVPCLSVLASATAQATPVRQGSARDQAIVHFNEGNEAFTRGDTHEAYKQYQTAWQLHQTFDIACNLGRAEAELGKLPQAAGHLAYCLEHFSSSPQQDLRAARQRYSELFDTVRTQVSSLTFDVDPNGAEVFVNGAVVGKTPLDRGVFVLPGTQIVELRLAGYHDLKREIAATAGENRSLRLMLEPLEPSSTPLPPQVSPQGDAMTNPRAEAPAHTVSARTVALVTGTALTVAGAGIGLGFYLQGAKLDDEASVLRQGIQEHGGSNPNPCSTPEYPSCSQLADTIERRDDAWTISTVGFVSMGVFGLGTLATWLWWPTDSTATHAKRPTITPVVTSQLLGVTLSGTL